MLPVNPDSEGKWGLMGGVFDPIHYGHLLLAECAAQAYGLDGVLFVVSYNPPHRPQKPVAFFDDRLNMVRIGTRDNCKFMVSDVEKDFDIPAYTLNLVKYLKQKYSKVLWHLILGIDNIAAFDSWYKPEELIDQLKVIVGNRPGYDRLYMHSCWRDRVEIFDMPLLEISSTMIRQAFKDGKSVRYLLPEEVRQFIVKRGLYR